jgi:hypothetical protein
MTNDMTQSAATGASGPHRPHVYAEPIVRELPAPAPEPAGWSKIW